MSPFAAGKSSPVRSSFVQNLNKFPSENQEFGLRARHAQIFTTGT